MCRRHSFDYHYSFRPQPFYIRLLFVYVIYIALRLLPYMTNLHHSYEIRCPIHGFIALNTWEKEIISQPAFQRLRRIWQLAWTDQVYPGAMHTRFEHSLGVMHTATLLYSAIRQASSAVLQNELGYKENIHLRNALAELLPNRQFPKPIGEQLKQFLAWDDWKVLGLLADGKGGEHGYCLTTRKHYRLAYASPEISSEADIAIVQEMKEKLGNLVVAAEESKKSWYNTGQPDIPVISNVDPGTVLPLSRFSNVVLNMKPNNQILLYVRPEDAEQANATAREVLSNARNRQGSFGFVPSTS
jgi:hypothetical protein